MSLTPVSSSYEDIGGVPPMKSCYSAGMKRCGICMEERSPLWVRRSKSKETLCRLLITMVSGGARDSMSPGHSQVNYSANQVKRKSRNTMPRQLWAMPGLPFELPRLPCPQIDKTFYVTLMLLASCPGCPFFLVTPLAWHLIDSFNVGMCRAC
jgi:hypothetical protein